MNRKLSRYILWIVLISLSSADMVKAEDVLFFGNSFTIYNKLNQKLEAVATSKGKSAKTLQIAKVARDWDYHLKQPETDEALKSQNWDWIVLQAQSLAATHVKGRKQFMEEGKSFYNRIAEEAPQAGIILFETWAYSEEHPIYQPGKTKGPAFENPDAMTKEIHEAYMKLRGELQALNKDRKVIVAPIGTAFMMSLHEHPEITLHAKDHRHPSPEGTYLAALVIYELIYQDSPAGADPLHGVSAEEAKALQEVAVKAVSLASKP